MHDWYPHVYGQQVGSKLVRGLEGVGFAPLYEDVAVRLRSVLRFWTRRTVVPAAGGPRGEQLLQTTTRIVVDNGDLIEFDNP